MSEESEKTFVLKKSELQVVEAPSVFYIWRCPLCGKRIVSVYRDKAVASAKLHLERTHSMRVEVIEE
jgi:hypothetical protein